jgi:TRAP-type C4-dicarboxylate transport system permease small subunit
MKKIKNKVLNKVRTIYAKLFVTICAIMLLASTQVFAQAELSKAKTALGTVVSSITGIYDTVYKVLLAIAAIVAIIGGFIVYSKWNSGDPNATKLAAAWFGSALFLVVIGVFIKAVFL